MPDDLEKKVDQLLAEVRALRPRTRRVDVEVGENIKLLPTDDVVYAAMNEDGKRLQIFTRDGQEFHNYKSLADLERQLADDPRFCRVHKSFLVNLEHVTAIKTVPGGRELSFAALPGAAVKVAQGSVKAVEQYFGI